jgi:phosphatidylserine/phosphatidylglycerophosphate/cardiolipin synthase-like enzyme
MAQSTTTAPYVLTDWPVIQAFTRAADRGVKLRIRLLSPDQNLGSFR